MDDKVRRIDNINDTLTHQEVTSGLLVFCLRFCTDLKTNLFFSFFLWLMYTDFLQALLKERLSGLEETNKALLVQVQVF